jgi:hypothetical protein
MANEAVIDLGAQLQGPLDVATFPETLAARVITPGARPRVHGYDVEEDLARHYAPADLLFLSLTGELPSPEASIALGAALTFLAPVSVAHASVHAAVLARVCGTTVASTIGVAAIGLAEQARLLLDEHAELLTWLAAPSTDLPPGYRATSAAERTACARLSAIVSASGLAVPHLEQQPTRNAALLMVLYHCGLKERAQLEIAIVSARLPCAMAEAMQVKVAAFDQYPTNLPLYRYEDQA